MTAIRENFRVVVEVDEDFTLTSDPRQKERILERRAKSVIAEIRRHVDGIKSSYIISDRVCEHCGYGWEDPPGCCSKACDEWDIVHPHTQDAAA